MLPDSVLASPPKMVYVAGFGQKGIPLGMRLLHELRTLGLQADSDYRSATLKAHLRQADRLGASFVLIIGDDEAEKELLILRDMMTKEQQELPLSTAARSLANRLASA
jgi:histidyl-tRNA synthetase